MMKIAMSNYKNLFDNNIKYKRLITLFGIKNTLSIQIIKRNKFIDHSIYIKLELKTFQEKNMQ